MPTLRRTERPAQRTALSSAPELVPRRDSSSPLFSPIRQGSQTTPRTHWVTSLLRRLVPSSDSWSEASSDLFGRDVANRRYCNPYTTTRLENVGRYTCPLAIVGAANFA